MGSCDHGGYFRQKSLPLSASTVAEALWPGADRVAITTLAR